MTWTSSTREFGFFTPADGSRDVFIRLSPDVRNDCEDRGHEERAPSETGAVSVNQPDDGFEGHQPGSRVEVRTRYQSGQWAPGYEIVDAALSGYHVRRFGTTEVLSEIFVPTDVRRAGD